MTDAETYGYKPYPSYKISGASWLGEIPEHWEARQIRTVARVMNGATPSTSVPEYWDGDVVWITPDDLGKSRGRFITGSERRITQAGYEACGTNLAPPGSIVLSTRAPIGHIGVLRSPACTNQGCRLLSVKGNFQSTFAFYQLTAARPELESLGQGTTFTELSKGTLAAFPVALPPVDEQATIVRYLDDADQRIRAYVSAKERLIALLEEERQAVIHQAVTKGLDPNVKLKPSGVEWLGDVPGHWEVRRIKSLSVIRRGASPRPIDDQRYFDENGEFAWVRISDVTASNRYLEKTTQRLSKVGQDLSVELQPGSLFLSIAGSVGKPIITKIKCCIHDGFVYFPKFRGDVEFLYRILSTEGPFARLGKFGTQLNLNTDTVGDIFIGCPPTEEQQEITHYMDAASAKLDAAVNRARRQIDLIEEYRTRLIAEVVTGKLDVREAKP